MKQIYELSIILNPRHKEEEFTNKLEVLKKLIIDHKGEILFEEKMGKIHLAYPIKKIDSGIFNVFYIKINKKELSKITKEFSLSGDFLRFMINKVESDLIKELFQQKEIGEKKEKAVARKDISKKEITKPKPKKEKVPISKIDETLEKIFKKGIE